MVVCMALIGLGGCVPTIAALEPSSAALSAGAFDFKWRLSGERAIAPLQVFNNQQQVWLQFHPEQHLPAIFAYKKGQYHALQYQHFDPYVVIEGQWRELLFQGGRLQARAQHESIRPSVQQPQPMVASDPATTAATNVTQTDPKNISQSAPTPLQISSESPLAAQTATKSQKKSTTNQSSTNQSSSRKASASSATTNNAPASNAVTSNVWTQQMAKVDLLTAPKTAEKPASASGQSAAQPVKTQLDKTRQQKKERTKKFAIGPADETMRQALQRWAKQVGWHFGNEHWGPEMDYPVMNTAEFNAPFENAVEQLLDSVQLGAQPLRACFYSNRVLRIIPESQSCLPTGHIVDDNETATKES